MRQSNGSELFGTDDPRSTNIGIIDVAADDDKQSILAAVLTQDKLGRKHTVLILPDENSGLHRAADFEGLENTLPSLQTQLVLVASKNTSAARFARRHHLPLFLTLDKYAQYAQMFLRKESEDAPPEDQGTDVQDAVEREIEIPLTPSETPSTPLEDTQPPLPEKSEEEPEPMPEQKDIPSMPKKEDIPVLQGVAMPAFLTAPPKRPVKDPRPITITVPSTSGTRPAVTPNRRHPVRKRRRRFRFIAVLFLLLLVLIGVGILSVAVGIGPIAPFFPGTTATVTITADSKALQHTYVISAVTGLPDATKNQVEARFLSTTSPVGTKTVKASGHGITQPTVANGTFTFYNAFPSPQTVPKGTIFTDSAGIQIVSDQVADIPAATPPLEGSIIATAHALVPGGKGNIATSDFKAAACCHAGVTVENTTAFSGGQDAQAYSYIEQNDIDTAANDLFDGLSSSGKQAVQAQISPNEQLIGSTRCLSRVQTDHQPGDRMANVTVTETVACLGEVFDRQGAEALAENLLKMDALKISQAGYALIGQMTATVTDVQIQDAQGSVSLHVRAEGRWTAQFDAAQRQHLVKAIADKGMYDARSFLLQQTGVRQVNFAISGNTRTVLPNDTRQIHIVVQ